MALRSIVCLHNGFDFEASSLATAIALAKAHEAYLRIVHASYIARPYSGLYGEAAIAGTGWSDVIEEHVQRQLERSRQSAERICADLGLPLQDTQSTARPRAAFVPMQDVFNKTLVRDLSVSDLIVMGAAEGSGEILDQSIADLALFSTGRPVLLVRPRPNGAAAPVSRGRCGLAWNGSPEAVHALVEGKAVFDDASMVHLLVTKEPKASPPTADQRLALDYLEAHDVDVTFDVVERDGHDAAHAILARARELDCDYLAMGAYGHSVFREMLLGGFSRTMLEEAQMPLLLCH